MVSCEALLRENYLYPKENIWPRHLSLLLMLVLEGNGITHISRTKDRHCLMSVPSLSNSALEMGSWNQRYLLSLPQAHQLHLGLLRLQRLSYHPDLVN